jgi:hypothetical protein
LSINYRRACSHRCRTRRSGPRPRSAPYGLDVWIGARKRVKRSQSMAVRGSKYAVDWSQGRCEKRAERSQIQFVRDVRPADPTGTLTERSQCQSVPDMMALNPRENMTKRSQIQFVRDVRPVDVREHLTERSHRSRQHAAGSYQRQRGNPPNEANVFYRGCAASRLSGKSCQTKPMLIRAGYAACRRV